MSDKNTNSNENNGNSNNSSKNSNIKVGNSENSGEENDRVIKREEVEKALKGMRMGKAPGLDGCHVECLSKGGGAMVDWLVRLLNVCFREGRVPSDWRSACVVPLYKGKGDKYECSSYRGISLLSIVGKVYERVLIERIRKGTEEVIGEEQCGFRRGRGCVDQVSEAVIYIFFGMFLFQGKIMTR